MNFVKRLLMVFGITLCFVTGSLLTSPSAEARTYYRSHSHCTHSYGKRHCYKHRHHYRGRHHHSYRAHHRYYHRYPHSTRYRSGWNNKR